MDDRCAIPSGQPTRALQHSWPQKPHSISFWPNPNESKQKQKQTNEEGEEKKTFPEVVGGKKSDLKNIELSSEVESIKKYKKIEDGA